MRGINRGLKRREGAGAQRRLTSGLASNPSRRAGAGGKRADDARDERRRRRHDVFTARGFPGTGSTVNNP